MAVMGRRKKKKTNYFRHALFYGPYQSCVLEHVSRGSLPLLLLKVIKACRVESVSLMDCPSADGHQFRRHVFLLSVTTTETVYKQLKNK